MKIREYVMSEVVKCLEHLEDLYQEADERTKQYLKTVIGTLRWFLETYPEEKPVEITICGRHLKIYRSEVVRKLKAVKPRPIRVYYVVVDGVEYPMRQVAEIATGLPSSAISTPEAFRVCQKLGFEVRVRK